MTISEHAHDLLVRAATAAADKKAHDIVAIDVSDKLAITDAFLVCSASNDRQVRAVVDGVEEALDLIDVDPIRREGEKSGRWVLLDYGDIVVHVQHEEERGFYDLARLWKDCPLVDLPEIESVDEQVVAAESVVDSSGSGDS
jgi:ribosome-associated protein